jgi:hypothetical protein
LKFWIGSGLLAPIGRKSLLGGHDVSMSGYRFIGNWRAWIGVALVSSCLPSAGSDGPDTAPVGPADEAAIRLFVPAVARVPGATLPIQVEVDIDPAEVSHDRVCVAVTGEPGQVAWVFPEACNPEDESATATGAGGSAEGGAAGAGPTEEPNPNSATCIKFRDEDAGGDGEGGQGSPMPSSADASNLSLHGAALARYRPQAQEETVVLFGAVYADLKCTGPTLAETTLIVRMVTEPEGGAGASPVGGASTGGEGPGGTAGTGGTGEGGQSMGGTQTQGGEPNIAGMAPDAGGQGGQAPVPVVAGQGGGG